MDEDKWLTGRDPRRLYAHARKVAIPVLKSGRRRLRLYACACCRQIWGLLGKTSRAAVEASEGYADDRVSLADLRKAWAASWEVYLELSAARRVAAGAAHLASASSITSAAWQAASEARQAVNRAAGGPRAAFAAAGLLQCDLLRDIFGNPFRPVSADPAWLRWNDGTIRKMAQAFYDERAFDRLPVLADALEDAGCADEAILAHLRGPGPHVRGCWALDLLRGE